MIFRAHIPKARYFEQLECTTPTKLIPRGLPEIKCFENYVSRLGVSDSDHIVLYDRSPMGIYASTRAWWLFKVRAREKENERFRIEFFSRHLVLIVYQF